MTGVAVKYVVDRDNQKPFLTARQAGSTVYIKSTNKTLTWTGFIWEEQSGSGGTIMSDADIKAGYERNANTNAFTDAEKTKLSTIEGSHFKGVFTSLAALTAAEPTSEEGSYAYINDGTNPESMAIWDGSNWVDQGQQSSLTNAEVKTKYEANPDTNAFTDAEKAAIPTNTADIQTAISFTIVNKEDIADINNILPEYATKNFVNQSIINTYYGTTDPTHTIGKDNDKYRKYPTEQITTVESGTSLEAYSEFFFLKKDYNAPDGKAKEISIFPQDRKIEIYYGNNSTVEYDDITLQLDGGVKIPLTISSSTSSAVVCNYSATYDTDIQAIIVGTLYLIEAMVLSGEYKDYIKIDGHWMIYENFGRPVVTSNVSDPPTKAELTAAYKLTILPNWIHNKDFYVKDTDSTNMFLVKYRADGAVDEATAGSFYYEKLIAAI